MSGAIADQIRSASGKLWFDRFDLGGFARFARALHPAKTAACIAADTGLPVDSVKKWLAHAMLNGAPAWMSSAARAERGQQLHREIAAREAELAQLEVQP